MNQPKISLPQGEPVSDYEALRLVEEAKWYHRFEIRPGILSGGKSEFHPRANANMLCIPEELTGLKALDIGAWDGPLTFELERRGAQAYALDIQDPKRVGFDAARRIVGSKAVHYQGSVYDLPCGELKDLDMVAFRGVYYHLKYPLLAFECIAASMKLGGTLHFEGEGLLRYIEDLSGKPVDLDTKAMIDSDAPICLVYPNRYKNSSNWFVPTPAALRSLLIAAGFELREMRHYAPEDKPNAQRLFGWAVKTRETELREHPLY